ncbi:MAG: hypothetical protein IPI03_06815 [Rubrivivax sp.]|nr:hypothetical protein [Rubrivivax sp.]
MQQFHALLILGVVGYGLYLAWGLLVLLVTAPRGSLTEALAAAEVDEEEEDRQRRRRRRDEYDDLNEAYRWDDDE